MTDSTTADRAALTPIRRERITRAAAAAALAVQGVHHLGSGANRVIAGVQAAASGRDPVPGVRVADRLDGVEVLLHVVAGYPVHVVELADRVLHDVAVALAAVDEGDVIVAVIVADVHGPFDREEPETETEPEIMDVPAAGSEVPVGTVPASGDVRS